MGSLIPTNCEQLHKRIAQLALVMPRYVERAKDIVNIVAVNDASDNPLIGKLREEIKDLRGLLEKKEAAIVEHKVKENIDRKCVRGGGSLGA